MAADNLSASCKALIDDYLRAIGEKEEELRHKRTLRVAAVAAVFAAIVGSLVVWGLNAAVSDARNSATVAAAADLRNFLNSDLLIEHIKTQLNSAESEVIQARTASEAWRSVASDAQASYKKLRARLDENENILAALKRLDDSVNNIAKDQDLQKAVARIIFDDISRSLDVYVRSSGLKPPDAWGECLDGELLVGGSCINRLPGAPILGNAVGIGPVFTEGTVKKFRCQLSGDARNHVEAFAVCLRIKKNG